MTQNLPFDERLKSAVNEIRAFLRKDGGDLRVVKATKTQVVVQFMGNCMHCHIKNVSLNTGVKAIFKKHLPEIKTVKEL